MNYELSFTAENIDSLLYSLATGKVFGGELTTESPVPTDTNKFYIAREQGAYVNLDFSLSEGDTSFVWYDNGVWTPHNIERETGFLFMNNGHPEYFTEEEMDVVSRPICIIYQQTTGLFISRGKEPRTGDYIFVLIPNLEEDAQDGIISITAATMRVECTPQDEVYGYVLTSNKYSVYNTDAVDDIADTVALKDFDAHVGDVAVFDSFGNPVDSGKTLGVSVPADAVFTDTKNTAGADTTNSFLYLIGAISPSGTPDTHTANVSAACLGGTLTIRGHRNGEIVSQIKTSGIYSLKEACAKNVDTSISSGTTSTNLPTSQAVENRIVSAIQAAQVGAAMFQGDVNSDTDISSLTAYSKGWYWVVATAGTYAGQTCEVGDFIFCVSDYNSAYSASDFSVVQNNIDMSVIPRMLNVSNIAQLTDAQCDSLRLGDIVVANNSVCYIVEVKTSMFMALANIANGQINVVTYVRGVSEWEIFGNTTYDITAKADKVSNATNGNFAGLDSNGNLTDSGSKASDFLKTVVNTTYSELVTLKTGGNLVSGAQYRITDYTCTTTQSNTQSAGHVFDIIVTADSATELNENARAAHHSGDTYFQNCNLDSWELKYCLENDTDRFIWADATNGKGVIYYMKDEWNNECTYDFKNILTTVNNVNYYTFDALVASVHYDLSVAQTSKSCYDNIIEKKNDLNNNVFKLTLGRNIFKNTSLSSSCNSNTLKNGCLNNTFGNSCKENTFEANCSSNIFGNDCVRNLFGNSCTSNTFGNNCASNTFGNSCNGNTFGNYCHSNILENNCFSNTFGNYCQYITVFNNIRYCSVTGGNSSSPVKNAQILNGTAGTSAQNKLTITFSSNKAYTQVAGLVDGTGLRIWIAEDTVTGPTSSTNGNIAIFDGTSGKIVKDSGLQISELANMVEITWYELKLLKENSELVPSRKYRITDYNTTVSEDLTDVSVAEHQFDIIVTALSESELDHRASAIQHEGDTYFSGCDLSKWKLWYDIENNTEKYSWALDSSSSGNGGAKGGIPEYAPEYITGDETTSILVKEDLSPYLVFQGIETITIKGEDVECYIYGTSVQAAALNYIKIFCQEYPSKTLYGIDIKGGIHEISLIDNVSETTQPTNGTKIIAKSITSSETSIQLNKAGISPELEFNGRIVMYKGQNCYSYGSSTQYTALENTFGQVSDIIVEGGVSPIAPKKIEEPGTNVIILDYEVPDPITTVSQETVVVGGNSGGTGVIYRMIDEWGNDCPYDFKNIMFKRWEITACSACPNLVVNNADNTHGIYYGAKDIDGNNIVSGATYGNNTDWFYTFSLKDVATGTIYDFSVENSRELINEDNTVCTCHDNSIGRTSSTVEYDGDKYNVCILNNIVFIDAIGNISSATNTGLQSCSSNTFDNNCSDSTFGPGCQNSKFLSDSTGNTAGSNFNGNTFGSYCQGNKFGNDFQVNSAELFFMNNSFGNYCVGNKFNNYYLYNVSLDDFETNQFGNYCYSNTFGTHCYSNAFGNDCHDNTFGTYFNSNTIGNNFHNNTFGNYCQFIAVFEGVEYCDVTGGFSNSPVKNAQILNGAVGTAQNRLTITFEANKNYTQIAGYINHAPRIWIAENTVTDVTVGGTSVVTNGVAAVPAIPTVPTISTNVASDKADNTKTTGAKAVYDEIHPAVVTSQPAGGFAPNVLYNLGTLTGTVTFAMASAGDSSVMNHWYWTFETSSTAPTVTWPQEITSWFGGSAPTINASKHYEISVLNGIGVAMEV